MSMADVYYGNLVNKIINNGVWDKGQEVRTVWEDGTSAYTKSIIGEVLRFDNSEIPILTQKKVAWKTAIKEILWIWQKKSNRVQDLRDIGVNIWNEWEMKDGTIGKAYGHQMGKASFRVPNTTYVWEAIDNGLIKIIDVSKHAEYVYMDQVNYTLFNLKYYPASRRHITTLWSIEDLDEMSLTPCVWKTQWFVKENKLSLMVEARSNDIGLGHPFNVFQYNMLQRMFAQVCGYELGDYIYIMGDAHIYERHIEPLQQQISLPSYSAPKLWINPEVKSFYDFTIDDFRLQEYDHGPTISMEVAI